MILLFPYLEELQDPGQYPFDLLRSQNQESGITLKEVLGIAGGFEDPIFRKTINEEIVILRLDENQFYATEYRVNYSDANSFKLEVNDKIFVYELPQYKNSFTYTIKGEVNSPGTYPLKEGLSLSQAIELAGGVTEIGSINSVSVTKNLLSIDSDGNEFNKVELVSNIDLNFQIADQNVITILPKTNVIRVDGNVYNPGFIAHQSGNGMTMSKAIELAGGYKPYSLKKRAYVVRANGEIEQVNIFRGKAKKNIPR